MTMRINHNVAAVNTLRNLNESDQAMSSSLEKLSTGESVNHASDGPATLVISEQMRGQIGSIEQAIKNSEASVSMIQTTEASLVEVNNLLISMRQLTIHAANEGANDSKMLAADQMEIENAIETIDRIARTSQFGTRVLLDGSNGANGVAVGDGLEFMEATPETKPSPAEGYAVNVTQPATQASKTGQRPIQLDDLLGAFQLVIAEGGRVAKYDLDSPTDGKSVRNLVEQLKAMPPETRESNPVMRDVRRVIAQILQNKVNDAMLKVSVRINPTTQALEVTHNEYGSEAGFSVSSTSAGVLASSSDKIETSQPGKDIQGTIDGKVARGQGFELTGAKDSEVEGLKVRFLPVRLHQLRLPKGDPMNQELADMPLPAPGARPLSKTEEGGNFLYQWEIPVAADKPVEGYVHIAQNSLSFQVGPTRGQQVRISLLDAKANRLATGITNHSGFRSLKEIRVTDSQGAQDSLLLLDAAITQVAEMRANLGAFQKNTLDSNTKALHIAKENLVSAESSLRDADMAAEMSQFTRHQVMVGSGMAMLAQANQTPRAVLQLLRDAR
ncbi:MAG: flagellin [Deltaproteobacteria bacterium]|nr:flagellin [Deltaproteobacteria bacterium]